MISELKGLDVLLKPLWVFGSFLAKRQESLKFVRNEKEFNNFNRFYGPLLFEKPTYCYAYLTFRLMNERRKILLREVRGLIFSMGDQKSFEGEILENPPTDDNHLGKIYHTLHQFPIGYDLVGLPNKMEIPTESCRDYFLALRFPGFEINNVEGKKLEPPQDEFSAHVGFDLTLEFTTSRNRQFHFKTMVWAVDPAKRDPKRELKI